MKHLDGIYKPAPRMPQPVALDTVTLPDDMSEHIEHKTGAVWQEVLVIVFIAVIAAITIAWLATAVGTWNY